MKNFRLSPRLLFVALSLVGIFAIGVFSCKENVEVANSTAPPLSATSFLKFDGEVLESTNAHFIDVKSGDGYSGEINVLTTEITRKNIKSIYENAIESLGLTIDKNILPEMIVFYSNNKNLSNLNIENVIGMSVWIAKRDEITKHRLFRRNSNNTFVVDETYDTDCGQILNRDINYIAGAVLKGDIHWVSYSVVDKNNPSNISNKPYLPIFTQNVINNADFILSGSAVMSCGAPCLGFGGFCAGASCDGGGPIEPQCNTQTANAISKNAKMGVQADLSVMREIRDEFMSKFKKGEEYTQLYYKISNIDHIFGTVNLHNALETISLANDLIDAANILKQGDNNEIVIDNELKDKIQKMIQSHRKVSKNGEFQKILDKIEFDIQELSLKTKREVSTYIQ
jgi:hypothetical protein